MALGLFVALDPGRRSRSALRAPKAVRGRARRLLALVAAPAAYLVHALVDYNWDFLAVTAPTMVALGVLAGAGPSSARRARRRPLLALGRRCCSRLPSSSRSPSRGSPIARSAARRGRWSQETSSARSTRRSGPASSIRSRSIRCSRTPALPSAEAPAARRACLHPGGRAAARQPGDVVHARDLRVRRAQEHVRRVPLPQQRLHARPGREPVGEGGPLDVARDVVNEGGCAPWLLARSSTASSVPGGARSGGSSSQANHATSLTSAESTGPGSPLSTAAQ